MNINIETLLASLKTKELTISVEGLQTLLEKAYDDGVSDALRDASVRITQGDEDRPNGILILENKHMRRRIDMERITPEMPDAMRRALFRVLAADDPSPLPEFVAPDPATFGPMSRRTFNSLLEGRLLKPTLGETLDALARIEDFKLLRLRNFGRKSLKEIRGLKPGGPENPSSLN